MGNRRRSITSLFPWTRTDNATWKAKISGGDAMTIVRADDVCAWSFRKKIKNGVIVEKSGTSPDVTSATAAVEHAYISAY